MIFPKLISIFNSLIIFSVFFTSFQSFAQNPKSSTQEELTLLGQVFDSETKQPIPFAEVFISTTTRGCITDQNGVFNLKVPFIPCTLVADHVSYDAYIAPLDGSLNKLEIQLSPRVIAVDEVKITGKNNRKRNLRFFYSHFIKEQRGKIKILNDSVLYFKSDKKEFVAYTNEPLIIVNKLLGYKTKLTIKKFSVTKAEYPNGPKLHLRSSQGNHFFQIEGVYYYEELKINSLQEMLTYEKNRRMRYFGSERHFLKSVYHGNAISQGFQMEIFPANRNLNGLRKIKNPHAAFAGKNFYMDCDSIRVTYKFGKGRYPYKYSMQNKTAITNKETSMIYRLSSFFTLRENGSSPDLSLTINGPMTSTNNLANSVPLDYDPFK